MPVKRKPEAKMTETEWKAWTELQEDPLAHAVFLAISESLGIAGWSIAKKLDRNPQKVLAALSWLIEAGLISGLADLRENFTLTEKGFSLYRLQLTGTKSGESS